MGSKKVIEVSSIHIDISSMASAESSILGTAFLLTAGPNSEIEHTTDL